MTRPAVTWSQNADGGFTFYYRRQTMVMELDEIKALSKESYEKKVGAWVRAIDRFNYIEGFDSWQLKGKRSGGSSTRGV